MWTKRLKLALISKSWNIGVMKRLKFACIEALYMHSFSPVWTLCCRFTCQSAVRAWTPWQRKDKKQIWTHSQNQLKFDRSHTDGGVTEWRDTTAGRGGGEYFDQCDLYVWGLFFKWSNQRNVIWNFKCAKVHWIIWPMKCDLKLKTWECLLTVLTNYMWYLYWCIYL